MNAISQNFAPPSIVDPVAAINDARHHVFEHVQMLGALDVLIFQQITELSSELGNSRLQNACDQVHSFLSIARRDLEATQERLDAAALVWGAPTGGQASAIRKWEAALAAYEEASRIESETPDSDPNHDEAVAVTNRALDVLIGTPVPGWSTFKRKVAIVFREAMAGTEYVNAAILADIDALTRGGPEVEAHSACVPLFKDGDDTILSAFDRWRQASSAYNNLPDDEGGDELYTAYNDAAEEIRAAIAVTPSGVAAKLWVLLHYELLDSGDSRSGLAANLDDFRDEKTLVLQERLMLSALRSLEAMGGSVPVWRPEGQQQPAVPAEVLVSPDCAAAAAIVAEA